MSNKPCPGCGKVDSSRRADELCWECKGVLEAARKLHEQFSTVSDDQSVVAYGEMPHWNGYFHCHGAAGDPASLLQRIFFDLVKSVIKPYTGRRNKVKPVILLGKIDGLGVCGMMNTQTADAIVELHKAIEPILDAVYEAGRKDGSNMLMRLATGDLAVNDFLEYRK